MNKRTLFISIILALIIMVTTTGCINSKETYPRILIDPSADKNYRVIDVGYPYVYSDFDVSTTDSGKDIIVHFDLGRTDEQTD